jgi:hypothetical protein
MKHKWSEKVRAANVVRLPQGLRARRLRDHLRLAPRRRQRDTAMKHWKEWFRGTDKIQEGVFPGGATPACEPVEVPA